MTNESVMDPVTAMRIAAERIGLNPNSESLRADLEQVAVRECGCRLAPGTHVEGCTVMVARAALDFATMAPDIDQRARATALKWFHDPSCVKHMEADIVELSNIIAEAIHATIADTETAAAPAVEIQPDQFDTAILQVSLDAGGIIWREAGEPGFDTGRERIYLTIKHEIETKLAPIAHRYRKMVNDALAGVPAAARVPLPEKPTDD